MVFSTNIIKGIIDEGDGLARGSHYIAYIVPPPAMRSLGSLASIATTITSIKNTSFLAAKCQATTLPGKKLATTPFQMYGTVQEMPYGINFAPWNATFMCTNSMQERRFFDAWFRAITDPHSNNFKYYDDWVSDVIIVKVPNGLPDAGSAEDLAQVALGFASGLGAGVSSIAEQSGVYAMHLQEAYPVEISSQELTYESETYITLNVDFQYRRYKVDGEALGLF